MPRARMRIAVALSAALVSATLIGGSALVLHRTWQGARESAQLSLQRMAQVVENTLNRQLLQVDSALAGLPALFASLGESAVKPDAARLLLQGYNAQSLIFRDLVLVEPGGRIFAAARPRPANRPLPIAAADLRSGASGGATAFIGPLRNPLTGEWAVFLARPVTLPGVGALQAVAEVPLASLTSGLADSAGDLPGLRIALETGDGRLVASLPHEERAIGLPLKAPVSQVRADGTAFTYAPPGAPTSIAVARPTLYGDIRVAVTLGVQAALGEWMRDRNRLVTVVVLAELLVLASTAALFWALRRQEQLEGEREQARQRLENAIEAMSDGFVMWDRDDRLITSNATYHELYEKSAPFIRPGATFEEIIRRGAENGQYPQSGADLDAFVADVVAWHRRAEGSLERLLPDGRWLLVKERRTATGETVGIRTDITALKQALDDLAAANERARRATAEAQAASQAKTEFLASMSHEIRTPLNGILGYTDLLLDDPALGAEQARQLDRVKSAGAALLTIVDDVLDFSKIEAGQVEIDPRPFAPAGLLDSAVSIIRSIAERKALAVELAVDPNLPPLLVGDEDRLRQVLLNLLNNAVKFTPRGSVGLAVTVEERADALCTMLVEVTDTGIGIPEDRLDRLFQRFSQVDSSTRREFGGTGLGLAISKRLLELMGGQIGVRSREGEGSTFWFRLSLPVAEERREGNRKPAAAPGAEPAGALILLAEDNEINQEIARLVLEAAGHRVDRVPDGAAAVMAVQAAAYDLVLMDVQMPVMDGLTATARIRALPGPERRVPILAMTANVLPQQVAAFREAGMDDHIGKPFKREELYAAIARWRGQASPAALPLPDAAE